MKDCGFIAKGFIFRKGIGATQWSLVFLKGKVIIFLILHWKSEKFQTTQFNSHKQLITPPPPFRKESSQI